MISMNEAKVGGDYNRNYKVPVGEYLCEVVNVRWKADGFKGARFFLDMKVVSPSPGSNIPVGYEVPYSVCPDDGRGGGKMTPAMARAKEIGKIQTAVAACFGHPRENASTVTDEVYQTAISQRPVSPCAGRLVVLKSVAHVNKTGQATSFNEVLPVSAWRGEIPASFVAVELPAAAAAPIEAKVAPKAPPPVKKAAAVFPPKPWVVHPEDPEYFWNEDDDTQAPVHIDDLKTLLGAK